MGIVYHGSKEHGLKQLEPRKSTHGVYVYATPDKVLSLLFSGRSDDDFSNIDNMSENQIKDVLGIDKLRTLYYKKKMYSKNQND